MLPKLPHLTNQLFLSIAAACIIAILILLYDSSQMSFNSYATICSSNYGKPEELTACMSPFYNQSFMDSVGIIGALIVLLTTITIFIFQHFKKAK